MSPNDYFIESFSGVPFGRARAQQPEDSFRAVQAAFAKLPREREIKENRVNFVIATATSNVLFAVDLPYRLPTATGYVDGLFIAVKMPVSNGGPSSVDVNGLGAKPILDIQGNELLEGQWEANAIIGLRYNESARTGAPSGHFVLQGGGVRGERGPAGPPAGVFSLNASKELIFDPTEPGPMVNFGPVAPFFRGVYSASTEYEFLNVVRVGSFLHLHVGITPTTNTPVTNTAVWQKLAESGSDGGLRMEFRTATSQADPGNGMMRFNHATPASVTRIFLDDLDADGNSLGAWVDTWDDSGAHLVIKGVDAARTLVYNLTEVARLTGYRRLNVTHIAGTALPGGNGDLVSIVPLRRGIDGVSSPTVSVADEDAYRALPTKDPNTIYYWSA